MKKRNILLITALMVVAATGLVGCIKQYGLRVSTNDLYFGVDPGTKSIAITANCKWTVVKNDDADWYTISAMSGKNDGTITITVDPMEDCDYRASSFFITVPNGHVRRTVFVSQNKLDFDGMVNKVFGVLKLEHWNTDFYGQIIEDSYYLYEFDPYDTTTGYLMYFYEDGQGMQRDRHESHPVYYPFTYNYNPVDQILHIEFETVDGAPEDYDPLVLTASDSLYRFMHEWKTDWWERADMRKVGTINPEEKSLLMRAAEKRQDKGGIFRF